MNATEMTHLGKGQNGAVASPLTRILPYLLLALAVLVAYSNVYDNALLFDDTLIITGNTYLQSWDSFHLLLTTSTTAGAHIAGGFYRPVQTILYFFIYQLTGPDPFLYHLLNICLHIANACLIFRLGCLSGFQRNAALLGSLIWAMHPLHTEVITYASGTAEPLFVFFALASLLNLLPDFAPRRLIVAIPLLLLSLFSKEAAVVVPALAVTLIYLNDPNFRRPKAYLTTLPLWLVVIAYALWRMSASGFDGPQTYDRIFDQHGFSNLRAYADHFEIRLYTFLATLPSYLSLLLYPTGLHMERSFPIFFCLACGGLGAFADAVLSHTIDPSALLPWAGIALIGVASIQIVKGRGAIGLPFGWGVLWFGAAHFPNTGLIFPMNAQLLEHWMYLPSIGLCLGTVETIARALDRAYWPRAKMGAGCVGLLIALILGFTSYRQNMVWRDPFTFYGNIFRYGEVSPRSHNNLALAYMERGDFPAAIVEFDKAIELTDTFAETRYNLALAELQLPPGPEAHAAEAIADLKRAIDLDPNFYRAWEMLGNIYEKLGRPAEAKAARARLRAILTPEP